MDTVRIEGDPSDVVNKLMQLGDYFSGRIADPSGAVKDALTAVGIAVLHDVHEHFRKLSEGGTGDDGTVWEKLSVVTLALRRKDKGTSAISRLVGSLKKGQASGAQRRMFLMNAKRLRRFYERGADKSARRRALKILEKMKPYISKTRYNTTRKELENIGKRMKRKTLNVLIFSAASALILRDSGDLFRSLEPQIGVYGQVFEYGPGWVEVGTLIDYAKYHQSPEPRKMKKDGTPILPRRPFLPDIIPAFWYDDAVNALREIIGHPDWMIRFLRG